MDNVLNGNSPIPILGAQQLQVGVVVLLKSQDALGGQVQIVTADALVSMIRDVVREVLNERNSTSRQFPEEGLA